MRTDPLVCFPYSEWMTSSLHGGHVERRRPAGAERNVWRIGREGGIVSDMFVESHLESGIDRRRVCQGRGGGGRSPTRRGGDHHSAGDTDEKAEMSKVAMESIELDMEELASKEGRLVEAVVDRIRNYLTGGDGLASQRNEGAFSSRMNEGGQ